MIPFWSLNDKLVDAELEEQIVRMHEAGIQGFFLHARGGLETEYMSEDWLARMETCIKKADELGMEAWLYDENGWPSGSGNGVVPPQSEKYQQKKLCWKTLADGEELPQNLLGLYQVEDGKAARVAATFDGVLAVWYEANPYYIDVMCKEATERFIESTHQKYYERLKPYFDGRIKGFFTDEPQYGNLNLPWSWDLEALWQETYGEDMVDGLPLLFTEAEGAGTFRYRYYTLMGHLIVHNFMKPLYDWCTEHNCQLTGHMMREDTFLEQIYSIGAAMPCYEFFHKPGIDHLCRVVNSPLLPKQLSSAAAQLDRPTITETFAGCGWDVSMNELKWIAQWQFVNGVTDICQHLEGYTLRGLRKRDWPASLFIQQPWFDEAYRPFNDYFTRLGEALREGEDAADVLLLHTIRSAYMVYNPLDKKACGKRDEEFIHSVTALNNAHIPYHLGDEELMTRHGKVTGNGIQVGRCTYHTVVMPDMTTVSEPVYELLLAFAKAGGTILSLGERPTCIDGRTDSRIEELLAFVKAATVADVKALTAAPTVKVDGTECTAVHVNVRKLAGGAMRYYFANLTTDEQVTTIALPETCRVWAVDLLSGERTALPTRFENAHTVVAYTFATYADCTLETAPADAETVLAAPKTVTLPLAEEMALTDLTDNGLTLDYCRWQVDGGEWQPAAPTLYVWLECVRKGRDCDVTMAFDFDVEDLDGVKTMALAAEMPDTCTFKVNGQPYTFKDTGYYIDKSFRTSDIRPLLCAGKNTIEIATRFKQSAHTYNLYNNPDVHEVEWNRLTVDTELESIYLVGDFGVCAPAVSYGDYRTVKTGHTFKLGAAPEKVAVRNLTEQGLWFFAGKATVGETINIRKEDGVRYEVRLSKLYAPAAQVIVNGKNVGELAFAPYVMDVTDALVDGENTVEIRLFSGLRNALGPHHLKTGDFWVTSPGNFTQFDEQGRDNRGCGWEEDYHGVLFGFEV